jgi:hypothetical protein
MFRPDYANDEEVLVGKEVVMKPVLHKVVKMLGAGMLEKGE